jgi:purine-binding chemotaxis protein CheW
MKKKNKIENSLERLFSAKKSDLNQANEESPVPSTRSEGIETTQSTPNTPDPKPQPVLKSKTTVKASEVPAKPAKPAKTKVSPAVQPSASIKSTSVPESPVKKAAEEYKNISSSPVDNKPAPALPQIKTKTEIDKPMTDAIVAKKTNTEYDSDEHLVIFSLDHQAYGISIMIVESIIKMQEITWVPRAHPSIEGATNLRGVVLPVINLCKKLNLPESDDMGSKRIIVVAVQDIISGFVVDNVQSVYRIAAKEISPPSPMVTSINTKYIKGIAKNEENGLVIILDPLKIFESIIVETSDRNQIHLIK